MKINSLTSSVKSMKETGDFESQKSLPFHFFMGIPPEIVKQRIIDGRKFTFIHDNQRKFFVSQSLVELLLLLLELFQR